ncbi:MAG: hypothetical protein ABL956_16640 [Hyphomonadaceae bacterium]
MMQVSEAKVSAFAVSLLTGVGLTLMLNTALRDLGYALSISVPATLVVAAVLMLLASENVKKGGEEPPKQANKGK